MSSDEESDNNHYISEEEEPVVKRKKKKDPNKPKRNMSAFFLYSNANRARVKEENPGIAFGQVAKILSKEFKAIDDAERAKYDKLAVLDKERYQREMEHYEPPSDEEEAPSKKRRKKDPNAPKRNMSAYFIYSQEIRSTVRVENPEAGFGMIAKIISKQFKALDEDERKRFDNLAAADKERYQKEMAIFKNL
jgi:predicted RNase H-like nuclease